MAVSAFGQVTGQASTDKLPGVSMSYKEAIRGEHLPIIFTGTDTIPGAGASSTTDWMPIGWSPSIGSNQGNINNQILSTYNPEVFTLVMTLRPTGDSSGTFSITNDSVGVAAIRFETAFDTAQTDIYDPRATKVTANSTVGIVWNADSTNLFVADGNYDLDFYGTWLFEDVPKDSVSTAGSQRSRAYPLRILHGAYVRFVYTAVGDSPDTVAVDWTFITEH